MIPRIAVTGTNLSITRVGFGCGRLHGGGEFRASAKLLEAALGGGIRHFDTAPNYGAGLSESVLGEVLAGIPKVTITTKIGIPRPGNASAPDNAGALYRKFGRPLLSYFPKAKALLLRLAERKSALRRATHDVFAAKRRLGRDQVLRGLEDSLDRLKRSHVDILLIHEPDQFEIDEELRELFNELQRTGVISAFGLAFDRVADVGSNFGTVAQGRIRVEPWTSGSTNETRIFHGLLRHGWHHLNEQSKKLDPGAWIGNVLREHPDAAVIFSASEPHQIRKITSQLQSFTADWDQRALGEDEGKRYQ